MKKLLLIFFAVTLAIGFAYVIDADAQCSLMGGGGCGMSSGGYKCGCGMSGKGAMKGACGNAGCMCGSGCPGAGCKCRAMSGIGGQMMGGHAASPGMANPMMKVFLDETKDLRKELMLKRFDYSEAERDFDVPIEDLMKMEKEIRMLQMKINRYWLK